MVIRTRFVLHANLETDAVAGVVLPCLTDQIRTVLISEECCEVYIRRPADKTEHPWLVAGGDDQNARVVNISEEGVITASIATKDATTAAAAPAKKKGAATTAKAKKKATTPTPKKQQQKKTPPKAASGGAKKNSSATTTTPAEGSGAAKKEESSPKTGTTTATATTGDNSSGGDPADALLAAAAAVDGAQQQDGDGGDGDGENGTNVNFAAAAVAAAAGQKRPAAADNEETTPAKSETGDDDGSWTEEQQPKKKRGRPTKKAKEENTISKRELNWNQRYDELKEFRALNGTTNVPHAKDAVLCRWVERQRDMRRAGTLAEDRVERLTAIDFNWSQHDPADIDAMADGEDLTRRDVSWNKRFQLLKEFKKTHGHCNVPSTKSNGLGDWVVHQRQAFKKGTLQRHRRELLSALDFEFDSNRGFQSHKFDIRFAELKEFHAVHGHCKVPRNYPNGLGTWVDTQKRALRDGTMKKDREERLNALGFDWGITLPVRFEERFRQLMDYYVENGHYNVPKSYPGGLGEWAAYQRHAKREGKIKPDKEERLNAIGFRWL